MRANTTVIEGHGSLIEGWGGNGVDGTKSIVTPEGWSGLE